MNLTEAQRQKLANDLGVEVNEIPTGAAITSGEKLKGVVEQTNMAIQSGDLREGTTVVGIVDRHVYDIDGDGDWATIDFTAIVKDERGFIGFATPMGLIWFTKEQQDSLELLLAKAKGTLKN